MMPDAKREHDARQDGAPVAAPMQHAITAAARRALDEAAARRLGAEGETRPSEPGGRGGLAPIGFGEWEVKGLASDF